MHHLHLEMPCPSLTEQQIDILAFMDEYRRSAGTRPPFERLERERASRPRQPSVTRSSAWSRVVSLWVDFTAPQRQFLVPVCPATRL